MQGSSQAFTITPDEDYGIVDVTVDGSSIGAVTTYTFTNVSDDHTIAATFIQAHTITATAGENGNISPAGDVTVNDGSDQTFTITPEEDYGIVDVEVDGSSVGAVETYIFTNVIADHTIEARFTGVPITQGGGGGDGGGCFIATTAD